MKILLVSEDLPAAAVGGLGMHVVALGNALIAQGHTVTLMGRDSPEFAECASAIGFDGPFIPGFGNPFRGWKEHKLGVFIPGKRLFFAWQIARGILKHAAGFDVIHYHGHHPMVGNYLPDALNFVQTRHDQGSDCITHTRFKNGQVCTETAAAACASCMAPQPNALQTAISACAVQQFRRHTTKAFQRHPVVFVSQFLRDNAARGLGERALTRALVVHNFCDESALPAPTLPRPNAGRVVHVAGRLDAGKGIGLLLDFLHPQLPVDWQVNVYGDGPLRTKLAAQHASAQVIFHGHAPRSQVVRAAAQSDAVVMPSIFEESCGTVVLEALHVGRPCFALRRGGTPELARYGAPGQLQLFETMPSLVQALLALQPQPVVRVHGESAGVLGKLPALLAIYRAGLQPAHQ